MGYCFLEKNDESDEHYPYIAYYEKDELVADDTGSTDLDALVEEALASAEQVYIPAEV